MKKFHLALFCAFSSQLVSCSLPLCENGDKRCEYWIKSEAACIDLCQPGKSTNCPEMCICKEENKAGCTQFMTNSDTNIACIPYTCKDDIYERRDSCAYGFDGTNCKPLCEDGNKICEFWLKTEDSCMEQCLLEESENCPEDCICSEDNNTECTKFTTSSDTDIACIPYTCTNHSYVRKNSCEYGFDGEECKPLCQLDDVKEISSQRREICVEGENGNIWFTKDCPYGFDKYGDCNPECTPGWFIFLESKEKDKDDVIKECVQDPKNSTNYIWKETSCEYGIDKSRAQCKPRCTLGETKFIDNTIKKCIQNGEDQPNWDERECKFGINESEAQCNDPCTIEACVSTNEDTVNCSKILYDENSKKIYRCNSENGWTLDNSCTFDFHVDATMPQNISIQVEFMSRELQAINSQPLDNLRMGICGECSIENSPSFCSINGPQLYKHVCDNGKFDKQADECNEFTANCSDDYGTIRVDLNTNRNHCGECNHKCGSTQTCQAGNCVANNIECVNGYARIQLGSRWMDAYCIQNAEALKLIETGVEDNQDRAYVLTDNIEIGGNWTPIHFSHGILFGNQKIITIKAPVSIFENLDNTYVDNLNIIYNPDTSTEIQAQNFGLLTNTATESSIHMVSVDTKKPLKFSSNSTNLTSAGGMIGTASDGVSIYDTKLNVTIQATAQKEKTSDNEMSGIGGLVGIALNTNTIQDVQLLDSNSRIDVHGVYHVGGLIGLVTNYLGNSQNVDRNVTQIIDNSGVPADKLNTQVTGSMYVGGIIGRVLDQGDGNTSVANIHDISIDSVELNLIQKAETGCLYGTGLQGIDQDEEGVIELYFGGFAGRIYGKEADVTITNIDLNHVMTNEILDNHNSELNCISANLGGLAGLVHHATLRNIHIASFKFGPKTSWGYRIGGFIGRANNINMTDFSIESFQFVAPSISNFNLRGGTAPDLPELERKGIGFGFDIGSAFGTIQGSTISNGTMGTREINISDATTRSGGFVGNSTSTKFSEIYISNANIQNHLGYSVGGFSGTSYNCTYKNIHIADGMITSQFQGSSGVGGIVGMSNNDSMQTIIVDETISPYNRNENISLNAGGLIGYASGIISITDANVKMIVIDPKLYGGLILNLSSDTFYIKNAVVETYADINVKNAVLYGLIAQLNSTLNGTISRTGAYLIVNERTNASNITEFLPPLSPNQIIKQTGNTTYYLYFNLTNDFNNFDSTPRSDFIGVHNCECCDGADCCTNNCISNCADSSGQELCGLDNRTILTHYQFCNGEKFYLTFENAFCNVNPSKAKCQSLKDQIKSLFTMTAIHYPVNSTSPACMGDNPACVDGNILCYDTNITFISCPVKACESEDNGVSLYPHCYDDITLRPSFCK